MSKVVCHITASLDGFAAGPRQNESNPLGEGGERLHGWLFADPASPDGGPDARAAWAQSAGVGAYIMGRNMFGPVRGPWDREWRGWWGEDPPFHAPVFVLTHYPHDPIEMDGGTVFRFVSDGVIAALDAARAVAGDGDVSIAGGAATVQQYLVAELLDELHLHVAPVLLGEGERLLENVGDVTFEPIATTGERAGHLSYRVIR